MRALLLLSLLFATAPAAAKPGVIDRLLRRLDPQTYAVHRGELLALFADPSPLRDRVWLEPAWREEKAAGGLVARDLDGLRVRGILPGSDLSRAGVVSGDILQTIDGVRLSGLAGALSVGWKLRQRIVSGVQTEVAVEFTRGGKPHRHVYRLVEAFEPAPTPPPTVEAPPIELPPLAP
ncbi:MAG: hypothetical protein KC620_12640 [Myxococcales bacterium]|nr:hypothetical protein [Myxococcales bacterium]